MRGKREKLLLGATVGLALLFAGERVLFSGLRGKTKNIHQAIVAEEVTLRTGVGILKRKDTILDERSTYADYLPAESQERALIAKFLKETERIAQEAGVSIADLTPDNQPTKAAEYVTYKAQLKAEATVEQLLNLFYRLQTSRLLIKLDRFSLSAKDESASALRLETTISMVVPK